MGGGGQQCVAKVTCMGWQRVVVSAQGGFFDWRLEDPCGTSIFDEGARLLEVAVYAHGMRWTGSAW
jgi:hypothetical protein